MAGAPAPRANSLADSSDLALSGLQNSGRLLEDGAAAALADVADDAPQQPGAEDSEHTAPRDTVLPAIRMPASPREVVEEGDTGLAAVMARITSAPPLALGAAAVAGAGLLGLALRRSGRSHRG